MIREQCCYLIVDFFEICQSGNNVPNGKGKWARCVGLVFRLFSFHLEFSHLSRCFMALTVLKRTGRYFSACPSA